MNLLKIALINCILRKKEINKMEIKLVNNIFEDEGKVVDTLERESRQYRSDLLTITLHRISVVHTMVTGHGLNIIES